MVAGLSFLLSNFHQRSEMCTGNSLSGMGFLPRSKNLVFLGGINEETSHHPNDTGILKNAYGRYQNISDASKLQGTVENMSEMQSG